MNNGKSIFPKSTNIGVSLLRKSWFFRRFFSKLAKIEHFCTIKMLSGNNTQFVRLKMMRFSVCSLAVSHYKSSNKHHQNFPSQSYPMVRYFSLNLTQPFFNFSWIWPLTPFKKYEYRKTSIYREKVCWPRFPIYRGPTVSGFPGTWFSEILYDFKEILVPGTKN